MYHFSPLVSLPVTKKLSRKHSHRALFKKSRQAQIRTLEPPRTKAPSFHFTEKKTAKKMLTMHRTGQTMKKRKKMTSSPRRAYRQKVVEPMRHFLNRIHIK